MKSINTDINNAELTGNVSSKKLKIASNWKMFKELISGIYSDKAYAIARETFANGIDSHEAAGIQSRPIEVHVPTLIEPFYSIRDFGVSMSMQLMEDVYCTLGESTKDDPNSIESNRYVGKFGLGSKSPFAYTDSFQVTAFYEGKAHMYDIFKGEEGPEMALLAIADSGEERGILVSFGINPKDINDFVRAIKRAAEGLTVTPKFIGDIKLHQRKILASGEGWKLLDSTQSGAAEARQGTVLYPLNFQAVIGVPAGLKQLFEAPFHFEFPIGSLDIVTSREALSYDEITSQNIIDRLIAVQADIQRQVAEKISTSPTYWEFSQNYFEVMKTFPEHQFGKLLAEKPTFKGRAPKNFIEVKTSNVVVIQKADPLDPTKIASRTVHTRFGDMTYSKWVGSDLNNKTISFREDKDVRSNKLTLDIHKKLIVVVEDMRQKNRYPGERIKKLLATLDYQEKQNSQLVWIRHTGTSDYAMARLFASFGRPDYTSFNLLDVEHATPIRNYARGPRMPFKRLSNASWITPQEGSEIPDRAYWVPMRNGSADTSAPAFSEHTMNDFVAALISLGMEDLPVIGIPASSRKVIKKQPGLIELYPFVKDHIFDFVDENALLRLSTDRQFGRTNTIVSKISDLIEWGLTEEKQLLADAFSGSVFETVHDKTESMTVQEGDNLQNTVVSVITILENRRISQAKEWNRSYIAECESIGEDYAKSILQNVENFADTLRERAREKAESIVEEVNVLAQQIEAEYPLFAAVQFRMDTGVIKKEILNYVFNKRLVQAETVVDTALAA